MHAGVARPWPWRDAADLRRRQPEHTAVYLARCGRRFSCWRGQSAARAYFDTAAGATPLQQQADQIDALYVSGISLAILPPAGCQRLAAVAVAMAVAVAEAEAVAVEARLRARGAMVAFDNNYRPRLWDDVAQARAAFSRQRPWPDADLLPGQGCRTSRCRAAPHQAHSGLD